MKLWKLTLAATALALSTSANSALVGRLAATEGGTDYQAYYDDVADLTWLADANAAQTSGYDMDGSMEWATANSWASSLTIDGVTGWRLATTDPAVYGYNQSGSEMSNLFYNVLGASTGSLIPTTYNNNYDLFSNVQSDGYWSATEYSQATEVAWYFGTHNGYQGTGVKSDHYFAWAVQSGDVSAVPIPAAVWLFGSGLIGLAGLARRKKE